MIDFNSNSVFKLKPINERDMMSAIKLFLIDGEMVLSAFQTIRDQVIFTNKRVIAANVQGIRGKKIDYTSIPYSKIQTYSVETAGTFDRDCEIEIYISAVGKVRFEIQGNFDIVRFNKIISNFVLN